MNFSKFIAFQSLHPLSDEQQMMRERVKVWRERVRKAQRDAVDNFKSRRSAFIGCPECKSRLPHARLASNVTVIESIRCPVCHVSLTSKPDQERIYKLRLRVGAAIADLREVLPPETKGKTGWVAGGWCSS